jgi:hypothetical protein
MVRFVAPPRCTYSPQTQGLAASGFNRCVRPENSQAARREAATAPPRFQGERRRGLLKPNINIISNVK